MTLSIEDCYVTPGDGCWTWLSRTRICCPCWCYLYCLPPTLFNYFYCFFFCYFYWYFSFYVSLKWTLWSPYCLTHFSLCCCNRHSVLLSLCTCQMTRSRFLLFCLLFFIFYNLHFHFVLCFVSVSIQFDFLLKLSHLGSLFPYCHTHSLHLAKDHYQLLCPYSFLSPSSRSIENHALVHPVPISLVFSWHILFHNPSDEGSSVLWRSVCYQTTFCHIPEDSFMVMAMTASEVTLLFSVSKFCLWILDFKLPCLT